MNSDITIDFQFLLECIQAPVLVVDISRNIVDANKQARTLFHSIPIIGKSCKEIFPHCEKKNNCPIDAQSRGMSAECEKIKQTMVLNAVKEQVEIFVVPFSYGTEVLFLHIITDNDIQNRHNLVMLEKNMTISTLASGIAHEFNNMNAGIQGIVELLLSQENLSMEGMKDLKTILRIVKRATHLIDQISILAQRKPSQKMIANIEDIVSDCISIIKAQFVDAGITIEVTHKSKISDLYLDVNKITLAIMNIVLNARDAMMESEKKILSVSTFQDNDCVSIAIKDTGCGINPEHLQRIFDPFFTTKGPLGHLNIPGTGLGLSVAMGIIDEHGGNINVENAGHGTVFTITLPIHTTAKVESEVIDNYIEFDFSNRRILIIEDDNEFAHVLKRALNAKNADVAITHSGEDSLSFLDFNTVDLILLDVHLPDMSVWDILKSLQHISNRTKIIIVSGNHLAMNTNYGRIVDYVLLKPFDLDELFNAIKASLVF